MLWLCFKLPSCLFGNTRDTSVMHEKPNFVCFNYMQPQKNKIQICSNKHATSLVQVKREPILSKFCSHLELDLEG